MQRKTASVRQAYTISEIGHDLDDTKNDSSVRSIALFANTVNFLENHFRKQEYEQARNKLYNDSGLVIQTSVGTPLGPRNLMRHYYRILDRIVKEHPDFPEFVSTICDTLMQRYFSKLVSIQRSFKSDLDIRLSM